MEGDGDAWYYGAMKHGAHLACRFCGKTYYVKPYRSNTAKYCSRSCLAKVHLPQFAEFRFKPTGLPPHRYRAIKTADGRYVREHRLVMEQKLGRKLTRDEHVHHLNGNGLDNRPENLIVISNAEHQKIHVCERQNAEPPRD